MRCGSWPPPCSTSDVVISHGWEETAGSGQDAGSKRPCGVRAANGSLLSQAEDLGEVERVGTTGEGFFKLAVDAEPFKGGSLATEGREDGDAADGPGLQGGLLVDQFPSKSISLERVHERVRRQRTPSASRIRRTWERLPSMPGPGLRQSACPRSTPRALTRPQPTARSTAALPADPAASA
jgi:hypothetical protein